MNQELKRVREELDQNLTPHPVTVRTFLWWFGYQRRRQGVVVEIRDELSKAKIQTVPDFEDVWLDEAILFQNLSPGAVPSEDHVSAAGGELATEVDSSPVWENREATYKIGRLAAANQGVQYVFPDTPIEEAITTMLAKGFSQLPVMTNERAVKGIVSWKSIGSRLSLKKVVATARDAMDSVQIFKHNDAIFSAMQSIVDNDYILVRGRDDAISGIVTASDLSVQFRDLTEPFLLLSEIENLLRNLIGSGTFEIKDIRDSCDASDVERIDRIAGVKDLNFGEYIRLLENKKRWEKLDIHLDRVKFCSFLNDVRKIRNDVMHFDPDGIEPGALETLREFAKFMSDLEKMVEK